MIKLKFIYFSLILILCSLAINCSDDEIVNTVPVDSSDFRYPFTDGSTWEFTQTVSVSDIKPDSIRHYFSEYPMTATGTITILYDTLINSVLTKCFLEDYRFQNLNVNNRYYYINNDTALILFYSRMNTHLSSGFLPNSSVILNHLNANLDQFKPGNKQSFSSVTDSIQTVLKYPVIQGKEWNIYFEVFKQDINKKYIGFENINTLAGVISCINLKTTYPSYINIDPIFQYYSKYGLMKRNWFIDDIAHTSITNPDGDGTFDRTDETIVTSFHINPK